VCVLGSRWSFCILSMYGCLMLLIKFDITYKKGGDIMNV
jgi:hypothetical protein